MLSLTPTKCWVFKRASDSTHLTKTHTDKIQKKEPSIDSFYGLVSYHIYGFPDYGLNLDMRVWLFKLKETVIVKVGYASL